MQYLVKGASGVGAVYLPKPPKEGDTLQLSACPVVGDIFSNEVPKDSTARPYTILSVGRGPSGDPEDTDTYPTVWVSPSQA